MVLACAAPDGSRLEFALQSVTRIGRDPDNDIQLFDSSASSHHGEIHMENGSVVVRDLGSSNGIVVNGEPVQQAVLHPGDVLKIGETEFVLEMTTVLSPDQTAGEFPPTLNEPAAPDGACQNHPEVQAGWRCSKCRGLFCSTCIVDGRKFGTPRIKFCPNCSAMAEDLKQKREARLEDQKSSHPLDPWKYPWRAEGLILLLGGTVFLAIIGFVQRFAMLLTLFIAVFTTGYMLAYSQKIITSTANGDHEPPTWPDFSDFMQDILPPFIQALAMVLLYLVPAFLVEAFVVVEGAPPLLHLPLLLAGLFFVPMAWLGMTMHDRIAALSPHFVIPSILRIPGPYLVITVQLILLVALDRGLNHVLEKLPIPFLPWLIGAFTSLYFLMVFSRMLGLLYYRNRERLGWF